MPLNKAWTVASFPTGTLTERSFKLVEAPAPAPKDGEVLVKNLWLSLDPYMRGRLAQSKSYVKGVEIGERCIGLKPAAYLRQPLQQRCAIELRHHFPSSAASWPGKA